MATDEHERVPRLEGELAQMNEHLGHIEATLRDIQGRLADKWLVGGGIGLLGLLMTVYRFWP